MAAPTGTPVNTVFPERNVPASTKFWELSSPPRAATRQEKPNTARVPGVPLPATDRPNAPRSAAAWAGGSRASPMRVTAALDELVHACSRAHPPVASCTCC